MLSFLIIFLLFCLIRQVVDLIFLFNKKYNFLSEFDEGWLWAVWGLYNFLMPAANLFLLLYLILPFRK